MYDLLSKFLLCALMMKTGFAFSQNIYDTITFSHSSDTIQIQPIEEASVVFKKAIKNIRKFRSDVPFLLKGNYNEDISENENSKRTVNAEIIVFDNLKTSHSNKAREDFIITSINKQNIGTREFPELNKINHLQSLFNKNPLNELETKHFKKASFRTDSILRKENEYFHSISFFSSDMEGRALINGSDYSIHVISIKKKGFSAKLAGGESLFYIPGVYSAEFRKYGEHYFVSHLVYSWGLLKAGNNKSQLEVLSEFSTISVSIDIGAFSGGKIMDKSKDLFIQY